MEISSLRSLAELGIDDPLFFQQWPTNNPFQDLNSSSNTSPNLIYGDFDHHHSLSHHQQPILDFKRAPEAGPTRPSKQLKSSAMSFTSDHSSLTNVNVPTMGVVKPKEETSSWSSYYNMAMNDWPPEAIASFGCQNYVAKPCRGTAKRASATANAAQTQDHILAERKRREKISQRFIALSALVPVLKKMDKASVLGDAVKYLKQLQDKVKHLEEQTKTRSIDSVVFVKKYEIHDGDAESCPGFPSGPTAIETLLEVQAKFCDKDVLIMINCERRKGVLEKAVAEIEKLNLSVVNSSVMAFGDSALNITMLAKKDNEFAANMEEVVNNLRGALKLFT